MLLIPLINYGPLVLQGLCGCVGIVTFFRESFNKSGLSFCIYTHEGLKGHKGAHLQKLGEFSLSLVIVFTAVSTLIVHLYSSQVFLSCPFGAQKDEKARHTGKTVCRFFVQELQATSFSQTVIVT